MRGFRSLLYQTADILDQKVEVCRHKADSLAQWADDLEDALAISGDPLVASLADYAPFFEAWRDQAKKLAEADALSPDDQEHLNADLATIASDFRDLISCLDRWPESQSELKSLRRSPMLGTWGQ